MRRPCWIQRGAWMPLSPSVICRRALPELVMVKNSVRILLSLILGKPTL